MALTNEQYNSILQVYEERQAQNRLTEEKRRDDVYLHIPRIREIDREISSASLSSAKLLLNGDEHALSDLHQQLADLHAEKKALLLENHYPEDYLDPVYHCQDCHDTGYVGNEKCRCFKQMITGYLYKQSNLRQLFKQESFSNFSLEYYSDENIDTFGRTERERAEHALSVCKQLVDNFQSSFTNLLLYGDVGVGKTFLTHCIARELLKQGYSVLYFGAASLFDILGDQAFHRDESASDRYSHILNCDLLIIDDLGTELVNTFTISSLFTVLNERLLLRKATVISTNLSFDQIEARYSERIASRINSSYQLVKMFGKDIRINKKLLKMTVAQD